MKTILYMAETVNGYVAKISDETPWSNAEWSNFVSILQEKKNLILGRKTYDLLLADGVFDSLPDLTVVVLSRSPHPPTDPRTFFVQTPEEAFSVLENRGATEAVIGGGAVTNGAFLSYGLADELWLDIEPQLFGEGIPFCREFEGDLKLTLIETRTLPEDVIHARYEIEK